MLHDIVTFVPNAAHKSCYWQLFADRTHHSIVCCFTGGHVGKWLQFTSWTEFKMVPYLKMFLRV